MILHLMKLFIEWSKTQRYEISKSLLRAQMTEGSSFQNHMLKMIKWIERLTMIGVKLPIEMCAVIIF